MPITYRSFVLLAIVASLLSRARAEDWPQFRGPTGQGTSPARGIPILWNQQTNVIWKQRLPGNGWSSPVVLGERIYLTAAVPAGDERLRTESEIGNKLEFSYSLRTICLDKQTGDRRWNVEISTVPPKISIHAKNSHASPTPFVTADRIFVHFGTFGTAALDLDGNVIWRKRIDYKPVHGSGGSPVVHQDLVIFNCDGGDDAFVIALDRETGEERWRTARTAEGGRSFSFSTPLVIEVAGQTELVSATSDAVYGYDPATGKQLWVARYPNKWSIVPRPVLAQGLILVCTGYEGPAELLAIRPGGLGDVTDTHILWRADKFIPHNPSPLVDGDTIFLVSDAGIASCRDLPTGRLLWKQRLGGAHSASPFLAEGRIYYLSEEGVCTVVKAARKYEELSKNDLKERTLASMVPIDGAVLVRTESSLYCIGE